MLERFLLDQDALHVLQHCRSLVVPATRSELFGLVFPDDRTHTVDVSFMVNGQEINEANVVRCKNGVAVNYPEDYMRRRDPDCMLVADDNDTDKPRYDDVYKDDFQPLRQLTLDWLQEQDLILMPFYAGGREYGYEAILVAPRNTAFFACALGDLQYFVKMDDFEGAFKPKAIIYLAPPFRHTHFGGKQIVVHNRLPQLHELFSYNLYPGPSAKKGIYGVLLNIGEAEGWVTAHASTVKVVTPYDNEIVIMHEGASGGGKSEMIENIHREPNSQIVIGSNLATGEKYYLTLRETCELRPITDDMALCHPKMQNNSHKLVVKDAEEGWFLRLDNIKSYGTEPMYEKLCIQPAEPLIFLNIQAVPNATCLIWEHTLDSDGRPCPNPRVIMPRRMVPNIFSEPVEVDVRSFGVRTPPCSRENPSYGILGMMHIIPPALAWLWRLVAPRGYNNPSVTNTVGMISEGVGSYWPFATGKMVEQANLLLTQVLESSHTRYLLIPNQHIGIYQVSFMPQWIAREYIARRGSASFKQDHLVEARCPLLGYGLDSLKVDGQYIRKAFLQPETQAEVGLDGYDAGAAILTEFFKKQLAKFNTSDLHPLGRQIIDNCMKDAPLQCYLDLIPMRY